MNKPAIGWSKTMALRHISPSTVEDLAAHFDSLSVGRGTENMEEKQEEMNACKVTPASSKQRFTHSVFNQSYLSKIENI